MKKGKRKVSQLNKVRVSDSMLVLALKWAIMLELCIPAGSFSPLIQKWVIAFCDLLKTGPSSLFMMLGWSWISFTSLMIQTMYQDLVERLNVLELDIMPHWSYALSLYKATTFSMQWTTLNIEAARSYKMHVNYWVMTMNTVPHPTCSNMGAKCSSKLMLPL